LVTAERINVFGRYVGVLEGSKIAGTAIMIEDVIPVEIVHQI
jgi:hypothetical protein